MRERVGVIDLSSFGVISVKGKDARRYLDRLFANILPVVCYITLVMTFSVRPQPDHPV